MKSFSEVYIASSWRHAPVVQPLTEELRAIGLVVNSWLENAGDEDSSASGFDAELWLSSEDADRCFLFDQCAIQRSNLIIYVGPSGLDAWAEVGYAAGIGKCEVWALWHPLEKVGIMRKLIDHQFKSERSLLEAAKVRAANPSGPLSTKSSLNVLLDCLQTECPDCGRASLPLISHREPLGSCFGYRCACGFSWQRRLEPVDTHQRKANG